MNLRWKPHVTVAAIIEREGRYLLVEEHTPDGLRLNNPAGHLDPGERPQDGCAREALEETAHHFLPTALVGIYMAHATGTAAKPEGTTYLRLAFSGELGAAEPGRALDDGIVRTLWMTLDEVRDSAARHRSPVVLQCVLDHHAGKRYPLDMVYTHPSALYAAP
ncbi:NUDIX hydrolase [Hydrogenophaga sp. OTU3427]|uniref:NUDIX hydrolase n=1 Tax=Hydrogenophaga sp. OTU3427 TaxID=3043856 RepID=UPI00313DE8DC